MPEINPRPHMRFPYFRNYSTFSPDRPLEKVTIQNPETGHKREVLVRDITASDLAQIEADNCCKKILTPVWVLLVLSIIVLVGLAINYYIKKGKILHGSSIEQSILGKYNFTFKK